MKTVLAGLGTLLGIVVIVASFISYAGLPPYMPVKDHTEDVEELAVQIAGGAAAFFQYKGDQIQDQIWRLEDRKREMLRTPQGRAEWFRVFEPRLRELKRRQEENKKTLMKYEKRLTR